MKIDRDRRALRGVLLAVALVAAPAACGGGASSADRELCARASACGLPHLPATLGLLCPTLQAVRDRGAASAFSDLQQSAALLDCVAATDDCEAWRACYQADPDETAACAGATHDVCVGDVAVDCSSPSVEVRDCGAADLVCGENANGAGCGVETCDKGAVPDRCEGPLLLSCGPVGVVTAEGCASEPIALSCGSSGNWCAAVGGETCAVVDGAAACVGAGEACDATTEPSRCDGSAVVRCVGGHEARVDCAVANRALTCRVVADSPHCVPAAQECDFTTPEECADGVITYCDLGRVATLDCRSYGLSGCEIVPQSNPAGARCVE
jgi:hypothetical protein